MKDCLAILSAVLLAIAAPPVNAWPLAFVALIPLYFAIRDASFWKGAGWSGATAFLAIGIASRWWVPVLQEFADLSFPTSLLLTLGLVFYQAIPYALWGGVCCGLHRRFNLSSL